MPWYLILTIIGITSLVVYLLTQRPPWKKRRVKRRGKRRGKVLFSGRLLSRVNSARRKRGLKPLGRTRLLGKVAAEHAKSMARRKHCDHHGFNKRYALIKRRARLYNIAENCYMFPARKYDSHVAKKLVEGWLKSPGHRANLLNPEFRRTGIGIAVRKGYVYATQIFTD